MNGRFSGQSAVGKVVERYPTQACSTVLVGRDAALEPLAHTQSPALDGFSQPAIWLELGAGALRRRARRLRVPRARRRRRARRVAPPAAEHAAAIFTSAVGIT